MPARFYDNGTSSRLKNKRLLSAFLDSRAREYLEDIRKSSFTYIFCTDEYLLQMNKEFLNHNTLTDIITFDLSESTDDINGEIYISVERVKENAEKFGISYEEELHRVIFHGLLHLCGYKDKKETDAKEMRRQENICLKQYFKTLS